MFVNIWWLVETTDIFFNSAIFATQDLFQHLLDLPLDDERVIYAEVCIQKAQRADAVWFGGDGISFSGVPLSPFWIQGCHLLHSKNNGSNWEGGLRKTGGQLRVDGLAIPKWSKM